jgi:fluoride exporter
VAVHLLLVLLGGALGSGARYLIGAWMLERYGAALPWGTLTVNVLGSFLLGLIATIADERGTLGPQARVFLVVGVLGGLPRSQAFRWRRCDCGRNRAPGEQCST